jgi:Tfp pilus assembly protein PilF
VKIVCFRLAVASAAVCASGCFISSERVDGESLCRAGFEQIGAGAYAEARSSFEAALRENPRYAGALYGLASVTEDDVPADPTQDEESEESDWDGEAEDEDLDPAYRERLLTALAYYDRAIESDPEFAFAYSSRSIVKDSLGDERGGDADYQQALRFDKKLGGAS